MDSKKIKFSVKEKTKQSGGYWGRKTNPNNSFSNGSPAFF